MRSKNYVRSEKLKIETESVGLPQVVSDKGSDDSSEENSINSEDNVICHMIKHEREVFKWGERRDRKLALAVTESTYKWLKLYAALESRTVTEVINKILEVFIAGMEAEKANRW